MRVLIAPDSFKGSLAADRVASCLAAGFRAGMPRARVHCLPLADGGEGTVQALVRATGGTFVERGVAGPLGDPVPARFGILGDGRTAVIEMAAASGLGLVPHNRRNPLITTSFGTGQLMLAALDEGCRRLIVGIGGSATVDGAAGALQALGVRFLDDRGVDLAPGGGALRKLARIDVTGMDPRVGGVEVIVACDVDNPLLGDNGAARVYGPQKGATPEMVKMLAANLERLARIIHRDLGKEVGRVPGGGAAGGLGAGLLAFLRAEIRSGVAVVLEAVKFEEALIGVDLVITGEGCIDGQTERGKVPYGVLRAVDSVAEGRRPPVIAVAGSLGEGMESLYQQGLAAAMSIAPGPLSLGESMENAAQLLYQAGEGLARLLAAGMSLRALAGLEG